MTDQLTARYLTLNTGAKMPAIGLGVWMGVPGEELRAEEMCKKALKVGYRLLDTAAGYRNEAAVGRAISVSSIPREELFVTTKFRGADHADVQAALDRSLAELNLDYVDLYLMHWPQASDKDGNVLAPNAYPTIIDTWNQMEKLLESGHVRAIGVSNFSEDKIERIVKECKIVPAVNQIELHPCLPQLAVREVCKKYGVAITAYSSLGRPGYDESTFSFFNDETFKNIAAKYHADIGQVLLSWAVQNDIAVIPKTESEERLKNNLKLVDLSPEELETINQFHKKPGMHRSLLAYHGTKEPYGVFGWTYEQLGWPMGKGGVVIS